MSRIPTPPARASREVQLELHRLQVGYVHGRDHWPRTRGNYPRLATVHKVKVILVADVSHQNLDNHLVVLEMLLSCFEHQAVVSSVAVSVIPRELLVAAYNHRLV